MMNGPSSKSNQKSHRLPLAVMAATAVVALIAAVTYQNWWPMVANSLVQAGPSVDNDGHGSEEHSHDKSNLHGSQDHSGHSHTAEALPDDSIELSSQALKNLGLDAEKLKPIELSNYRRTISIPAVIVPRPGRSKVVVSSPLSGIVTHVHAVTGEAVEPGSLLFEIRLTYEDLVETQSEFLRSINQLSVENREIERLEQVTRSGAVSGKSLLERRYAKQLLEASIQSQREALRLHGLSDRQVDEIGTEGKLLRDLQIVAPDIDRHDEHEELRLSQNPYKPIGYAKQPNGSGKTLVVEDLRIHKGQAVEAGEELCSLSDYSELYIEGKAFEQDIAAISLATERGWPVEAVFFSDAAKEKVSELDIAYVANAIDQETRTLSVFVVLPNKIVREEVNGEGQHFITWNHRIGQRLELQIPIEQWDDQIVLPLDAVIQEGADWFVFQQNGKRLVRTPVHVRFRDQAVVVIANDGSLFPGDVVARASAHQLNMAIKNLSGGGFDAHAGHTH